MSYRYWEHETRQWELYGEPIRDTLALKYLPTRALAKDWCYSRYADAKANGLPPRPVHD